MSKPTLTLSLLAYTQYLHFLRREHADGKIREVGGYGITRIDDPTYVTELRLVKQEVTSVTVDFDDEGVGHYLSDCDDEGLHPRQCTRVWWHTHPGNSPQPSPVDEKTFKEVFPSANDGVMLIMAQDESTYCRGFCKTIYGKFTPEMDIKVDFSPPFNAVTQDMIDEWDKQFDELVSIEKPLANSHPLYNNTGTNRARLVNGVSLHQMVHSELDKNSFRNYLGYHKIVPQNCHKFKISKMSYGEIIAAFKACGITIYVKDLCAQWKDGTQAVFTFNPQSFRYESWCGDPLFIDDMGMEDIGMGGVPGELVVDEEDEDQDVIDAEEKLINGEELTDEEIQLIEDKHSGAQREL